MSTQASYSQRDLMNRNIHVISLFKKAFLGNTLQVNSVELSRIDNISCISGIDFASQKVIFEPNNPINVSSDDQLIKIHFSLEGSYSYQPLSHMEYFVQVPENHCNLFFYPARQGIETFLTQTSRAFEIYAKPSALKKLFGKDYLRFFGKLDKAITNSNTYLHWNKSKFIPPHIRNRIMEIVECPYQGSLKKQYTEGILTVILIDLLIGRQSLSLKRNTIKLPNPDYLALVKIESYIRSNLKNQLRIIDLAETIGSNATKLKRDFKKVYGVTIFKYITSLKMEYAKTLITEKGAAISEAAYEVGFSQPQHFTTAFKRTMGYLPSQLKPKEE